MNALLYSLVFIILLSAISYKHLQNLSETTSMHSMYKTSIHKMRKDRNNNAKISWNQKNDQKNKRNGRLSLKKVQQNKEILMPVLINLVRNLYQDQDFFIEASNEEPGFEKPLFEYIVEHFQDEKNIKQTEHLTKIKIENPVWQRALYKMLKGKKNNPLSKYITVKNKTANVYNVQPELLEAFLGKIIAKNIIDLREKINNEYINKLLKEANICGSNTKAKTFLDTKQ